MADSYTAQVLIDQGSYSASVDDSRPTFNSPSKKYDANSFVLLSIPEDFLDLI